MCSSDLIRYQKQISSFAPSISPFHLLSSFPYFSSPPLSHLLPPFLISTLSFPAFLLSTLLLSFIFFPPFLISTFSFPPFLVSTVFCPIHVSRYVFFFFVSGFRLVEGVGVQSTIRSRDSTSLGSTVGDRESVRLHYLHGILHNSTPPSWRVRTVQYIAL